MMYDHMPAHEATPSLAEFLSHARGQFPRAAMVAASVLIVALTVAALLPPKYRATATLVVLPSPEFTVRAAAGSHDSNASALALDQIMKAETEILGSDDLHEATLRRLGAAQIYPAIFAPEPRGLVRRVLHGVLGVVLSPWRVPQADRQAAMQEQGLRQFHADMTVMPAKDSNVIALSFDSRDGARAAGAVNAMLALYAERRSRLYDDPQLDLVRGEAEAGGRAVVQAERALADFKRRHAISDYGQQRDLLLHRASQTRQAIDDAQTAISEQQARLGTLGRIERVEPETIGMYEERDPDVRLQGDNAALQALRAKLAGTRETFKDTSRVVVGLRAQIAASEAEAARLTHDAGASVARRGRNPSLDPLHLDRARATADLAAATARLAALQAQAQALDAEQSGLDTQEATLSSLERQRATAEAAWRDASRIAADRHLSEAEDLRRLANVRVIQAAMVPQSPRALPMLVVAAGFVFALLSGVAWIVAMFVLRPVFMTGEGLEAATGLPVLAVFARCVEDRQGVLLHA